jgi:ATP-dependent Clp endopeptidase proteolytic subunit ClpP
MLADAEQFRSKQATPPSKGQWYSVTNATAERATIRIYDEIGGWGVEAEAFAKDLSGITASEIEVAINSPGGSVFEGLAIYNALRTHPARIITRVDGLAASAASFIAQAGDERVMVGSAQMMIHDARGVVFGDANELRAAADFLERQSTNIAELYAERSGGEAAHYAALMAAETWLSAAQAVDEGLADSVLTPARQSTPDNKSNTSPQDALDAAAADAAAAVDASLAELKQDGERAAFLRALQIRKKQIK